MFKYDFQRIQENRKNCVDLIKEGSSSIKSSIYKIRETNTFENLDRWIHNSRLQHNNKMCLEPRLSNIKKYEMPRTISWKTIDDLYDITPTNYEDLIFFNIGKSWFQAHFIIML